MYYFYCPNCNHEDRVKECPRGTVENCRGGYGILILHYECPICHNLDAGFIVERKGDNSERKYYQSVIGMYQNIRGFKK